MTAATTVTDTSSEKSTKHEALSEHITVKLQDVDEAAKLDSDAPLDPEVAARIRRKIDWHLMPLMCVMYLMAFADKTTLGQSAVLGIIPGAHLNQNQFNWLGTIFYLSYLAFEYPQNLALQKLPVGKWMSINIFIWAVALLAHTACKSFGALFAVRFILGMCEGAITPGFMIVTSMFYTRAEQNLRTGYWFLMNGFAIIFLGFVSYGLLHTKTHNFMPWQWLMVITGIITLITSVLFWFFFPDSPTTAYFLTPEERVQAVQRIKINQAGVENKQWKREQFIETVKDPKVWIMALIAAIANVVNSLTNQRQLILVQFGFIPIQTTLLGCVDGLVEILTIGLGVALASPRFLGRGYAGVTMYIPALLGSILVNALPSHNKIGLLFSYWTSIFVFTPFVILLGWVGSIVSGHTKRTTTNAVILIAYAIGNAAGSFMWKKQYQPRNHVPWAVISACVFTCLCLFLLLRYMLSSENKRREAEKRDEKYDTVYITTELSDGSKAEKKVDRAFLDLTDIQNRDFRYTL
ncbi:major facilitator superfamily domain-containing protein [Crepidotus variabilis]|uniref:Major facilitator superfamily domain-containing protein n=1 Tax=Crepidotus variabilis TaxID=179855 RepID=A0A9P6ENM9_9AGAR|nr:major facilitator superfamily domain-containing protein [Crepidotus variabilis]